MKFDISKSWSAFAADIEKGVNVAAGNPTHFSDNAQPLSPPPGTVKAEAGQGVQAMVKA